MPFNYVPAKNLLDEKIVLITGSTGGIGTALSMKCAELGATVIICGRSIAKLEKLYQSIYELGLSEPLIYPADFLGTKKDDFQILTKKIEKEFGKLDGLVLNASLLGNLSSLDNYSENMLDEVMQVNFKSQFLMTQCLIPVLKKSESASVIYSSSSVGRKAKAFWGAYAISKFTTEALVQIWASEHENISKIRFNAVNPGATRTKMRAQAYPAENPRNLPTPEKVILPYIYLLSADSHCISGQSLNSQDKP